MPEHLDPLAHLRDDDGPDVDVLACGMVFLDIIFAGLPGAPQPGSEVWADAMVWCPGGIANTATAARRLGLRTTLASGFGDDEGGELCRRLLTAEGVDLGPSRRFEGWPTPVTVSIAYDGDRAMVTHGRPTPAPVPALGDPLPRTRAVLCDDLTDDTWFGAAGRAGQARAAGALVMADVGWDESGRWRAEVLDRLASCDVFVPNAAEAMGYTRTGTVRAALYALADRVPVAVVTDGADGAHAIDARTGEEASAAGLTVTATDPTGAGDVFSAGFLVGTLAGWPLAQRLDLACLTSALAVGRLGGSLGAPGWDDVAAWWRALRAPPADDAYHRSLRRRYGFLDDLAVGRD